MFSIIIPTNDSERALVPTLAALVPGATAGIVREAIVADGGSRDDTEKIADIAGCRFLVSRQPTGARLKAAAQSARGDWLMFIRPGAWKNEVVNVRSPWRMSCRCAPAAHAAAAAASALATFMRARPPNVAGIRCVYSSGSVRVA